ncbi:MAG TPA: galactokinase [Rubrivivax sp.]|nr:galactokinase [Rubrivivax sp.]
MNPRRQALRDRVDAAFAAAFGSAPTQHVRAPGRVNLIGEHTDYSEGFCLPCAVDRETLVALRPNGTATWRVLALDEGARIDSVQLDAPIERREETGWEWTDYVRGTLHALHEAGLPLVGADLAITGDVPLGAGLSSSAALEMAVATAAEVLADTSLPLELKARAGQLAEHRFAGCQCGILDQLASAGGVAGHALLLDCRTQEMRPIALPADTAVLVVHSRVQRGLVDSEYNLRRAQCQQAAEALGVPMLRDVDEALWAARSPSLSGDLLHRARHVVSENARTLAAAEALAAGDLVRTGALMAESHRSMREDFDIVPDEVDRLTQLMHEALQGEGGARMTGGGFGGCVVALAPAHRVAAVRAAVAGGYVGPDGVTPEVWVCTPSQGAGLLA